MIKPKKLFTLSKKLGPIAPLLYFYLLGLFIFTLSRTIYLFFYWERITTEPAFLWIFPIGLRMDTLILCYLLIAPASLLLLLPKNTYVKKFLLAFLTLLPITFVFFEMATYSFIDQFDMRPARMFIEYIKYPTEIVKTALTAHKVSVALAFVFLPLLGAFFYKSAKVVLESHEHWEWRKKLLAFVIILPLLILGGRSSLGHRPANVSTASFSNNHLVNELALNSSYSVFYALYRSRHEGDSFRTYGKLPEQEIIARVQKCSTIAKEQLVKSKTPMMHIQKSPFKRKRPLNIVIFLQESLGAEFVGILGGSNLTPNFDRLSQEGLLFTNLYATGTRTVRGIEACITGFLPTPGRSVVKLGLAKKGFFSAGALLKKHGYATEFIYGGMSHFDEMKSFFLGNGFDKVYDEPTFKNPVFHGVWGVSDEDLVRKAHEIFLAHGDKPFFAVMLSTSNHSPYEFPDGRIELYEKPKATSNNTIKYADYAIGELFQLAKTATYYKNTLFLVIADHNTRVRGDTLVPIHKFHIPGLLIGPDVPKGTFDKIASQIDIMPTLLHFTGLTTTHPMVGRNLMTLAPNIPGRAFMQYHTHNAYLIENKAIVMLPDKKPKQFTYNKKGPNLIPSKLDKEFSKDALAHSLYPWLLYKKRLYRLPE